MDNKIVSNIPVLMNVKNWKAQDLVDRGITHMTAYRVANGEVGISLKTAAKLCAIFEADNIGALFQLQPR
jgi:DNA-binding Xre family transcriptional regulator